MNTEITDLHSLRLYKHHLKIKQELLKDRISKQVEGIKESIASVNQSDEDEHPLLSAAKWLFSLNSLVPATVKTLLGRIGSNNDKPFYSDFTRNVVVGLKNHYQKKISSLFKGVFG